MTRTHYLGLRIVSFVMCLACLLVGVCSASATSTDAVPAAQELTNATYTTVVRWSASHSARVIGQLEDGTCVTVLGQRGSFYEVDLYDMTGYIAVSQIVHKDNKYYVNCQEGASETRVMEYVPHGQALQLRHSLMALAQKQLGKPYIYGSTGTRGFDCSGLMYYLYKNHGITLERGASGQLSCGIAVARDGLQVGDLIFFREPYETYPCSHVGIYVGNNRIIHAGHDGITYATLEGSYFGDYYLCARRVINTGMAELQGITSINVTRSILTGSGVSGRTVN